MTVTLRSACPRATTPEGGPSEIVAPAPALDPGLATRAQQVALTIAKELDVVGILAVELFETRAGRILVNELAMRPHNSGHWSIDGAVTSLVRYDTTYVTAGIPHAFRNTGDAPMTILWVYTSTVVTRTFMDTGETVEHLSEADMMISE